MLSGLKFIPRDHIDKAKDETSNDSRKKTRKSGHKKEKGGRKNKHSHYSSSDDEGLERIKSGSGKKKKWYDSDEDLSSFSEESGSQSELERDRKRRRSRKREKKKHDDSLDNEHKSRSKKKAKSWRKDYSSEGESLSGSESERSCEEGSHHKGGMSRWKDNEKRGTNNDNVENDLIAGSKGSQSQSTNNILRKEMGLEWMLRPKDNTDTIFNKSSHIEPEEASDEEIKKDNPRELNPYLKNNGIGYPEASDGMKAGEKGLLSTAVIGDGGASWRLKALKRAQEQAAREGRKLQEVVEERWGSMGHLAASVSSRDVAPTHAHLRAIKNRRKGLIKEEQTNLDEENDSTEKVMVPHFSLHH